MDISFPEISGDVTALRTEQALASNDFLARKFGKKELRETSPESTPLKILSAVATVISDVKNILSREALG